MATRSKELRRGAKMFAVFIGFGCGFIFGASTLTLVFLFNDYEDESTYLIQNVLSEENDRLAMKCDQLSQSMIETSQALRRTEDELAYYKNPQLWKGQ